MENAMVSDKSNENLEGIEKTAKTVEETNLELSFDPKTIQHLGVSLYSQLPSVLSELVSNSWDADAENVTISFNNENEKEIIYLDDGHGMTFDELNDKYLVIGRNRREETSMSPKGRKPIGKKGLGKLSVFGICDLVTVISVKNKLKNSFTMNLKEILSSSSGTYTPIINLKNEVTEELNSTKIILQNIRRKTDFDTLNIAISLAKKFTIFDQLNVTLEDSNLKKKEPFILEDGKLLITNELKFKGLNEQFSWDFPETSLTNHKYTNKALITGKIITTKTPISSQDMRGIYLTSRGKIVNQAEFYGARDNDQFHTYITGYLAIDFIDDEDEDLISTDRHSLNWENDLTKELKEYLQEIIKKLNNEWRKKRGEERSKELAKQNVDVQKFVETLPSHQRELGKKIIDPILFAPNIDNDTALDVTKNVIAKFNNEDFKEYAHSIVELDINDDNKVELIRLLNDWRVIEAKQYAALAETRIEVIKQFEQCIVQNTKEVPTLHNFLKEFPWLIDPRILEFQDEVRYSQILKQQYPDEELEGKDRRIDFLCSNLLGQVLYIVEIKRSQYQIDEKSLEQAYEYQAFIKEKYATDTSISNVVCYIIGGTKKDDFKTRNKLLTYQRSGEVFAKTYEELLQQSKTYHKEFIDKHKELNS
ncbi:ATP-binding protein [Acinetobacter soli]|uniref:ATP-binding protein n=1 Tax=Acinetobacter soli TaxID=487316 RepID=UPI00287DD6B7|nr:ATP-binding protein [Acinetobacter soli]MDS7695577.1 ATP-binding protein [Acinetobacter soli]